MSDTDTRDRLIRVETKVEGVESDIAEMKKTLGEIHAAFLGAKGARWALMGSLTVIGFVLSYVPSLLSYFHKG